MIEQHVKIVIAEWDDRDFVRSFESALVTACASHDIGRPETARSVEHALHDHGYPAASVECTRSVDDVLAARARWVVRRGADRDRPH